MSRTRRSIYTFFSGTICQVILMITGMIATRLLLRWLGQEKYGAYLIALQWLGYLALLELGRGTAILPLLIRSKDNPVSLAKTMQVAFRAWRPITLYTALAGLAIALLVPLSPKINIALRPDLRVGLILSVVATLLVPLVPARLLLEAGQRGYVVTAALLIQSLILTGLGLTAAWWMYGKSGWQWQVTAQFAAALIGGLIFQWIILWQVHRYFPGVIKGIFSRHGDADIHENLHRNSMSTLALHATAQVGFYTDIIIIGNLLGPALTVPFTVTQKLATIGQGQLRNVAASVWAPLGELYAHGEHAKFNRRILELGRLIMVLGFAGMVPLVAYNRFFVTRWVGAEQFIAGSELLTFLACANAIVFGLLGLWELAFNATGHLAVRVPVAITSASVNLVASIVATVLIGLPGPVLGTTVAYICVHSWWHPLLLSKIFGIHPKQLLVTLSKPALIGIPYGLAVWSWTHQFHHEPWAWKELRLGWIGLGAELSAIALIYLGLAWLLVLNAEERKFWFGQIKMRIKRKNVVVTPDNILP